MVVDPGPPWLRCRAAAGTVCPALLATARGCSWCGSGPHEVLTQPRRRPGGAGRGLFRFPGGTATGPRGALVALPLDETKGRAGGGYRNGNERAVCLLGLRLLCCRLVCMSAPERSLGLGVEPDEPEHKDGEQHDEGPALQWCHGHERDAPSLVGGSVDESPGAAALRRCIPAPGQEARRATVCPQAR